MKCFLNKGKAGGVKARLDSQGGGDSSGVDLFVTRLNHRLPIYVLPLPDPAEWVVDHMRFRSVRLPFSSHHREGHQKGKGRRSQTYSGGLAPLWPANPWFREFRELSYLPLK